MINPTIMFILLNILIVIALAGIVIKLYLAGRLRDIDGWEGIHKRKEFKNRNIKRR